MKKKIFIVLLFAFMLVVITGLLIACVIMNFLWTNEVREMENTYQRARARAIELTVVTSELLDCVKASNLKTDEDKAELTRIKAVIISNALRRHRQTYGGWPQNLSDLKKEDFPSGFLFTDGWGNEFVYSYSRTFELHSLGADGATGGIGPNADIRFGMTRGWDLWCESDYYKLKGGLTK